MDRPSRMVLSEHRESKGLFQISNKTGMMLSSEMYFVYFLRTVGNTLYIGVTEDLKERIRAHNKGKGSRWTEVYRGARCVYSERHSTLSSARRREMQLKKWSRAKKEALIAGDLPLLKELSRSKSGAASQKRSTSA